MVQKSNPWAMSDQDAFYTHMDGFADESQGMVRLVVVSRQDCMMLFAAAEEGNANAVCMAQVVVQLLRQIKQKPKPPMLCLTCDHTVSTPKKLAAVSIMMPLNGGASRFEHAVASPICSACLAYPRLQEKIEKTLHRNFGFKMWVDENAKT